MGIIKRTTNFGKRALGVQEIKENTKFVAQAGKDLLRPEKPSSNPLPLEKVPAEKIANAKKTFTRMFWTYMIILGLVVLYLIYLLVHGHFIPALVTLAFAVAVAAMAFRYHFWLTQIRKKKLGMDFQEWLSDVKSRRTKR